MKDDVAPLLTAAQMRAAEDAAIAAGTSAQALMERAGEGAARLIRARHQPCVVAILCGPGKNGGDGAVVARHLAAAGFTVRVAKLGDPSTHGLTALDGAELIVDALFGTGLARPLEGEARALVQAANAGGAPIVALDLPSGVSADTGAILGASIRAELTVTFGAKKAGLALYPGRAQAGEIICVDIGLAPTMIRTQTFENAPSLWRARLPRIQWDLHKYARGHCLIVSGPRLKTGAARLAAKAALRAGAGLVTVATPVEASAENAAHLTAIMLREADSADDLAAILADRRFTAALIGPGAGVGALTQAKSHAILRSAARAVLDADALTSFAAAPESLFPALRPDDVLTPHGGEFARLFSDIDPSVHGKLAATRDAAARAGCVVLFKGADTVIAAPDGRAAVNTNAPPFLATAGAGDVLAGVIAGLLAQGMTGFDAACAGAYLHGAAGRQVGPGLIAEDLEAAIPAIWAKLYSAS